MNSPLSRMDGSSPSVLPLFILIIFAVLFHASCNKFKEDFDFSKLIKPAWNPEFAVPLVNSTFFIADFLEDSSNLTIVTNPDQSLSFVYSSDRVFSMSAGNFLNLPDQEFDFPNAISVPPLPPGVFDTISFTETYPFIPDTATQRIDSIFLRNGLLTLGIQTNLNRDNATLRLKIPDIKNIETGMSLTVFANLNNPDGQNDWIYFDTTYELNDYKLLLNQPTDTLQNSINFHLDIIIKGDENPDLSPYDFNINGSLLALEFDKTYGYFSQYKLNLSDSLKIGIFEDALSGGLNIGEGSVKLAFDIHNSIGTPITLKIDSLYVESKVVPPYHVDIDLFGPGVPNIIDIGSPDLSQIGESVETRVDFNEANFADAFNISPLFLVYDVTAITNIDGDSTVQNFLLNESTVSLDADLEFQLFGSVDQFTIEDTVALKLDEDPEMIEYMLFRMNLTNGFPIDASAQVYFTDRQFQVLDSLITSGTNVLPGAIVGGAPEYRVTDPVNKITDVMIDRSRIDNILKSKYLLFKVILSTSDQQLVKIYDDYNVQIKLGTITGLSIETENQEGK